MDIIQKMMVKMMESLYYDIYIYIHTLYGYHPKNDGRLMLKWIQMVV